MKLDYSTILKHFKYILLFFLGILIALIFNTYMLVGYHIDYIDSQLNNNIIEYQEIDLEQLCKISRCVKVYNIEKEELFVPDLRGHLHMKKKGSSYNFQGNTEYKLNRLSFIDSKQGLVLYNKLSQSYYVLSLGVLYNQFIKSLLYSLSIILLLFVTPLYLNILKDQENINIMSSGREAILANKAMVSITENIHHELNTPLEVLDNKTEKIHRFMNKNICKKNKISEEKKKELEEDFKFIKIASEQIYVVLDKMKAFKQLRYSNGNKSIKDILEGSFSIIALSNTNFTYVIDPKLDNYSSRKLKNAEIVNIMLNHLKNSLEAGASQIYVPFIYYSNQQLIFRIIDNGNGIPSEIQNKIFEPNFSTKVKNNSPQTIRGNGMYLNKNIIKGAGGNIRLVSTSPGGTTIEITIPVKKREI